MKTEPLKDFYMLGGKDVSQEVYEAHIKEMGGEHPCCMEYTSSVKHYI